MSNIDDNDKDLFPTHLIKNPVISNPNSVPVSSFQGNRFRRERMHTQKLNCSCNASLADNIDSPEAFLCSSSKANRVRSSHNPNSALTSSQGM
jgi:hypothetical protein